MKRTLKWAVATLGGLVGLAVLAAVVLATFGDEPLRRWAERKLNTVEGYKLTIGHLHLNPLSLALDLKDITVIQEAFPDPPIAHLDDWRMSLLWREVLKGHLVSDHQIRRPVVYFTTRQAKHEASQQMKTESGRERRESWQQAVMKVYPFTINRFEIHDGEIHYRAHEKAEPLDLRDIAFVAENIRNAESKNHEYPSPVKLRARVADSAKLALDGKADFLAEPTMGIHADLALENLDLARFRDLAGTAHVLMTRGTLTTRGHVEYAPWVKLIQLQDFNLARAHIDYVYAATPPEPGKPAADKAQEAMDKTRDKGMRVRIEQGNIEHSEFGFVNSATKPAYRVFLSNTNVYLENMSNQFSDGTGVLKVRGLFMDRGALVLSGQFRPEIKSPDFDLHLEILDTPLPALNDLLRAYGNFDVTKGDFSLFTEMNVQHGKVDGYLKPVIKKVKAFDQNQDRDKSLLRKIYESVIGGVAQTLENPKRKEVVTDTELSGPVDKPRANTWELLGGLIKNAFFEAILPGFRGERRAVERENPPRARAHS